MVLEALAGYHLAGSIKAIALVCCHNFIVS